MILQALTATLAHLAVGLIFAAVLFLIAVLIHNESQAAREAEPEPEIEEVDIWAGLTPDRDLRRAETNFDSDRRAA